MDRLEAMSILVAVVEAGSLSAGARRLAMPLATVSRKVSDLEGQLGAQLLVRSPRRLSLTDSGTVYLAACKRILEQVSEADRAASGEYASPKGELTVTAPLVFGRLVLLPIVSEFLETYPDVDVSLILGDRNLNLREDHVDVALRIGNLPDSNLMATRVGEVGTVVCASPAHFARFGIPITPRDLQSHPCVTFSELKHPQRWTFSLGKTAQGINVRSRLAVNTAEAAIAAAIAGVGVTCVLSYQIADALRDGLLVRTLAEFEPAVLPVSLLFAGQNPLPLKLRAFLDFVKPRLRAKLATNHSQ